MARRRHGRSVDRWTMIMVIAGLLAFAVGGVLYAWRMELVAFGGRPGGRDVGARVVVTIERGATAADVGAVLQESGIVKDGKAFARWLVRVAKADQTIKAGTYALSPEMTPDEVLRELQKGLQEEVRFTIPEGFDQREIAGVIAEAGFGAIDDILAIMRDPTFIAECGVPDDLPGGVPGGVEGYLFPDTYQFPPGTPPRRILRRLRTRLDEVIEAPVRAKMLARGLSLHETLTMASLVEEEAAVARERRRISGVFHRRLRKGMKLQTDPTVLYGVDVEQRTATGRIRRSDLQRATPYNTYVIPGLPPGPISSPGLASIEAAVSPDDDDSIFFVSRGDRTHEFCATLACHEAAVERLIGGADDGPPASP